MVLKTLAAMGRVHEWALVRSLRARWLRLTAPWSRAGWLPLRRAVRTNPMVALRDQ